MQNLLYLYVKSIMLLELPYSPIYFPLIMPPPGPRKSIMKYDNITHKGYMGKYFCHAPPLSYRSNNSLFFALKTNICPILLGDYNNKNKLQNKF